ncbi:polysaccharide deacetylase family protein [Photobacterium kagoshimensis]|uniref:polysaccharide deacetylase family protein n=1 Tax=Photobacterium kagoshimensis TaxID=2910242 RepID=UPI003D10AC6D
MNKLTVVMYHYVRRIKQSRYPGIKGLELDDFIAQLRFFKQNYQVVTMEQVLAAKRGSGTLPNDALLLTFDDGYVEHFTHVYPILKAMNMQGSFYVPAKTVLEHKILDVNKLHFILASGAEHTALLATLKADLAYYQQSYNLAEYDDYYTEYAVANRFDSGDVIFIKRMLQHVLPEALRLIIVDKLFVQHVGVDEATFAQELYMDKHQLAELIRGGMHIGCHGYDHYWWDKLTSSELDDELSQSKQFLASLGCNMNQWTACYPYGSSSESVVKALSEQGCQLAFTTEVNIAHVMDATCYLLPRLDTNDFPPKSDNYLKFID